MEADNRNTMASGCSVHPRGHTDENNGPWSLRIGRKFQPEVIQSWEAKQILLSMEQPNENDNFTMVHVLFLRGGTRKPSIVRGLTFHRARWYRRHYGEAGCNLGEIEVRIKKRYGNSFPHPLPIGRYGGTCTYDADGRFAAFTFQATTLRKEPEPQKPKTIITPGDKEYGLTFRDAKRTLLRANGLEG